MDKDMMAIQWWAGSTLLCKKNFQDVAPHAYYVHCASHNLNLVLKDAMEAVTETHQFYDTIESVYNFFGHSIARWQKLQNVNNRSFSNPTLKTLNRTRCSADMMLSML